MRDGVSGFSRMIVRCSLATTFGRLALCAFVDTWHNFDSFVVLSAHEATEHPTPPPKSTHTITPSRVSLFVFLAQVGHAIAAPLGY